MAKMCLKNIEELPVVMEDVKFKRVTVLPHEEDVQFIVNIFKQSGNFEVFEGGSVVVAGKIRVPKDVAQEFFQSIKETVPKHNGMYPKLLRKDLYKAGHLKRYMYKDSFQAITECDVDGLRAKIEWREIFTSFMDAMLHPSIILNHRRKLSLPTSIEQVVIDPVTHLGLVNEQKEITLTQNRPCRAFIAGGIQVVGLNTAPHRQKTQPDPCLQACHFIYYNSPSNSQYDLETSLTIAFQIIIQNGTGIITNLNICEVNGTRPDFELNARLKSILDKQMMTSYEYIKKEPCAFADDVKFDVIILDEDVAKEMETVVESLSVNGFVLWVGGIPKMVEKYLQNVFQVGSDRNAISLLRPKTGLPKEYEIVSISNTDFGWLEKLKDLSQSKTSSVIYLVSQGETSSGIIGLTRCLLAEDSYTSFKCVFIDQESGEFLAEVALYRNQLEKNLAINVMRNNDWGTFVYLPWKEFKTVNATNASLSIETLGDLSSLNWIQRPVPASLPQFPEQELVHVFYSALNFRDVMVATGSLQIDLDSNATADEVNLGLEYSGVTASGRRVMGATFEAIALQLRVHPSLTWDVPETWSLQEAATVPLVYSTCYYAMIMRGQMKRGESILIQAGSGGVGIAAISIALSLDATVFTTVSTKEKKDFLKTMFPKLVDKNFGNSRDKTFQNLILIETDGKGVDLVLNSLAADLFQASLKCIAKGGRFLEIGKKDLTYGSLINSSMFLKDCSFHGIHLDEHMGVANDVTKKIHDLINEGIKNGVVKPLPRTVFNEDEVENAFRFLSTGKHKGKVLIKMRDENPNVSSLTRTISATPKVYFDSTKSYILIGGLGGFGLELANWMIQRGATKMVINSRRKLFNGYQGLCFKKWSVLKNVVVKVNIDDTGTYDGAKRLVEESQKLGPVGGVFNTALVLRDAILANQTITKFEEVFKCKIVSGRNMDAVTRRCCPHLEYFVMFSSVTGGRGNAGQTNYGMANAALERLCEQRKRDKLPGLAVQWGPIGGVGVMAGIEDEAWLGLLRQHINSCLKTLEKLLLGDAAVSSSVVLPNSTITSTSSAVRTPAEATAHILGIKNISSVDKSSTLSQLGLDSLMVTEIKHTLYRNFQLEFSADDIRLLTFESLTSLGNEKKAEPKLDVKNPKVQSFILSDEAVVTLNEWADDDKIVFFVHSEEGLVDSLRALAKKTKAIVYGLQSTKNSNYDSLPALAGHFVQLLREKQPKGPYRLCGYSYGFVLSLEIALQLEARGDEVTMVALDGSLRYVKNASKIAIGSKLLLKGICKALPDISQTDFADILTGTWEEALRNISTVVARKTCLEWNLVNSFFVQYYNRVRAVCFYEPKEKIRGKVTLIRAQSDNPYTDADDYGLQESCHQKVHVLKVPGNHYTIVMEESVTVVSKIINESFS